MSLQSDGKDSTKIGENSNLGASHDFEDYSSSPALHDSMPNTYISDPNSDLFVSQPQELGTLSWTWTPLSRHELVSANSELVSLPFCFLETDLSSLE